MAKRQRLIGTHLDLTSWLLAVLLTAVSKFGILRVPCRFILVEATKQQIHGALDPPYQMGLETQS
jgi:hypothetical protein